MISLLIHSQVKRHVAVAKRPDLHDRCHYILCHLIKYKHLEGQNALVHPLTVCDFHLQLLLILLIRVQIEHLMNNPLLYLNQVHSQLLILVIVVKELKVVPCSSYVHFFLNQNFYHSNCFF